VEQVRAAIEAYSGELAAKAEDIYGLANGNAGSTDPLYGTVAEQWAADSRFHCPAVVEANWHTVAHQSTYLYQFDRTLPGHETEGARHSGELDYVFAVLPKSASDADLDLSRTMGTYWTNFAKTGDPNSEGQVKWPAYSVSHGYMDFNREGKAVANSGPQRGAQCALYREILARTMR
jgi:para-nitrobenzyl esterase